MIAVKICGLTNCRDIELCVQAGVHGLGFVVDYPETVPWNLTRESARRLIRQAPSSVKTIVVTGGTVGRVLEVAAATRPDIIQLHHQETLQEVKELASRLGQMGIRTIKALRVDRDGHCAFEISAPAAAARALSASALCALLVDAHHSTLPGGSGQSVDLSVFAAIRQASLLPVILAGGIKPGNVGAVLKQARPFAIDVLSGVEYRPGHKHPSKVRDLMRAVEDYGRQFRQ